MINRQHPLPPHLQELQTPALVLLNDAFHANLARMASHCKDNKISLRPHAKTHKSSAIAKAQTSFSATGICCATLSEAEHLAGAVDSILLTSPLSLLRHVERLKSLHGRVGDLTCVIDSPEIVPQIEQIFDAEQPLQVLIDLDPGMHRTGIEIGSKAHALAWKLHASPMLQFRGIQCYAGNLMHVESLGQRTRRSHELWARVEVFKRQLESEGIPCPIVSGGGTGTYDIDWQGGVATELQAGSYPFMDLEYMSIEWSNQAELPFDPALFVLTTVVSANTPGNATTDAGLKAFSTDSVLPEVYAGIDSAARYIFKGDEHGGLIFEDSTATATIGTQLLVTPPHCDPTINLYDHFTVVDDDLQVLEYLPIDARSGKLFEGV